MKSKKHSSTQQKPDTSLVSEMLTPSEIAQLQQSAKDANAYFQKEFASIGVQIAHSFLKEMTSGKSVPGYKPTTKEK